MFYNDTLPAETPKVQPTPKRPRPAPAQRRVGLKYRILLLKDPPNCEFYPVDPTYIFRSRDKIRFQFESNVDGFLYVVDKQSGGAETLLFPHPDINSGRNKIDRGISYLVPATGWFQIGGVPGEERLTVIISKTPLKSLPQEAKTGEGSVSLESVVQELNRRVRSRDLELFQEKGPAGAPSAQPTSSTQSTIVINKSEDQNNLAYTEIRLKHQ